MPRSAATFIRVPRKHLIDPLVPSVQQTNSTCGPAVAQAILAKYGRDVEQAELARVMGTSDTGTDETELRAGLELHGLRTVVRSGASMEVLIESVRRGKSVVLCIRAWGFTHWVALMGESRRNWYFADPSTETGLGYIPKLEFNGFWFTTGRGIIVSGAARRNASTTVPVQRIMI